MHGGRGCSFAGIATGRGGALPPPQSPLNLQPQQKVDDLGYKGASPADISKQMGWGTLQTLMQLPTRPLPASCLCFPLTAPSLPCWLLLATFLLLLLCDLNSPPTGPSHVESQGRGQGPVARAGTAWDLQGFEQRLQVVLGWLVWETSSCQGSGVKVEGPQVFKAPGRTLTTVPMPSPMGPCDSFSGEDFLERQEPQYCKNWTAFEQVMHYIA